MNADDEPQNPSPTDPDPGDEAAAARLLRGALPEDVADVAVEPLVLDDVRHAASQRRCTKLAALGAAAVLLVAVPALAIVAGRGRDAGIDVSTAVPDALRRCMSSTTDSSGAVTFHAVHVLVPVSGSGSALSVAPSPIDQAKALAEDGEVPRRAARRLNVDVDVLAAQIKIVATATELRIEASDPSAARAAVLVDVLADELLRLQAEVAEKQKAAQVEILATENARQKEIYADALIQGQQDPAGIEDWTRVKDAAVRRSEEVDAELEALRTLTPANALRTLQGCGTEDGPDREEIAAGTSVPGVCDPPLSLIDDGSGDLSNPVCLPPTTGDSTTDTTGCETVWTHTVPRDPADPGGGVLVEPFCADPSTSSTDTVPTTFNGTFNTTIPLPGPSTETTMGPVSSDTTGTTMGNGLPPYTTVSTPELVNCGENRPVGYPTTFIMNPNQWECIVDMFRGGTPARFFLRRYFPPEGMTDYEQHYKYPVDWTFEVVGVDRMRITRDSTKAGDGQPQVVTVEECTQFARATTFPSNGGGEYTYGACTPVG